MMWFVPAHDHGFRAWRGAAFDRTQGARDVSLDAHIATNLFKQAAPANDSTRGLSIGALN
jgi:hypothetical protein